MDRVYSVRTNKSIPALLFIALFLFWALSGCALISKADKPVEVKTTTTDLESVGEYLRSLKELRETSGAGVVAADGEAGLERLRDRYKIPDRIKMTSPHGGREVLVFVFDAEDAVSAAGDAEILPVTRYKHLQSPFNIRYVYLLFENEPLQIGNIVYAFSRQGNRLTVFYNITGKKISFKSLPPALSPEALNKESIFIPGAKHIIRPIALAD